MQIATGPSRLVQSRRLRLLAAVCSYTGIAVVATWPLVRDMGELIAGDPGDPILNTAILVWNATTRPFSALWWNAPHFYPTAGATTFTENLLGVYPIASPAYWLTGNPLFAYNLTLFLTWPLSAMAVFLLIRQLTARDSAAYLAGLAFAFSPMRAVAVAHLQTLATFGVPLALLGLHGFVAQRRWPWLALFGAAWVQQGLANGYYILYGGLLFSLWLLYFCSTRTAITALRPILIAWAVSSLPLVPLLLKYRAVHEAMGMHRSINEILYFSASPRSWFEVGDTVWLWHHLLPAGKDNLFPGVAVVGLIALGTATALVRRPEAAVAPTAPVWLRLGLWTIVAASLAAIVAQLRLGPIDTVIGPIPMKMRGLDRALVALAIAGVLLVWLTPRLRDVFAERRPLVFYAAGVVLFAALACGPVLRVGDTPILDPAPYGWLMALPGFDELRVPTQIKMIHLLCLSVAAGLAFAHLGSMRRRSTQVVFALGACGLLLDGWMTTTPMAQAQTLWPDVEPPDRAEPILELPLGPDFDAGATLRASIHHRRVVNGVSGYDPPYYVALKAGLTARDPALLEAIATLGPLDIVIDGERDADGTYARYAAAVPGTEKVASDGRRSVYRVPRAATAADLGPALSITSVRAVRHEADWRLMYDGDDDTGWGDYPQQPVEWVTIDIGDVQEVAGVATSIGNYLLDFPRRLAIELSTDGQSWSRVFDGPSFAQTFLGFVRAPRSARLEFHFSPASARLVRLRQLDSFSSMWRISELSVHAARTGR
jgi:hypothetical protein